MQRRSRLLRCRCGDSRVCGHEATKQIEISAVADLIVISPMTRTIQTAMNAFPSRFSASDPDMMSPTPKERRDDAGLFFFLKDVVLASIIDPSDRGELRQSNLPINLALQKLFISAFDINQFSPLIKFLSKSWSFSLYRISTIITTEDRELFARSMESIGEKCAKHPQDKRRKQ
ncbi:hypothetical protein NHQ30_011354 [Ciborinia camelliae]|nr:hypothetical protein NHQ30_011354 [Ciborinia camelliae]